MPYLGWLLSLVIAEVVGTIFVLARQGVRYLPEVQSYDSAAKTAQFMEEFIAHGSTVTLVSNRLAWLRDAPTVQAKMVSLAEKGTRFEIFTAQSVDPALRRKLQAAGIRFFLSEDGAVPEARFTLVNADRSGAEKLAIARGTHPNHEITTFDSSSGPQIIGLAKDIVRRARRLAVPDNE